MLKETDDWEKDDLQLMVILLIHAQCMKLLFIHCYGTISFLKIVVIDVSDVNHFLEVFC